MKRLLLVLTLLPVICWGKVSNFNDLIEENSQAQNELRQNLEVRKDQSKAAVNAAPERQIVLESATYNAPTGSKALKFRKELKEDRPSAKKEMDRLAEELRSADREL